MVAAYHRERAHLQWVNLEYEKDGKKGGFTKLFTFLDRDLGTPKLDARLFVLMAGRAAEEKATGFDSPQSERDDYEEACNYHIAALMRAGKAVPSKDPAWFDCYRAGAKKFFENDDRWAEVKAVRKRLLVCGNDQRAGPAQHRSDHVASAGRRRMGPQTEPSHSALDHVWSTW